MLYLCFNLYNEAPHIREHFEAAKRAAPHGKIVVVDGAYLNFPHDNPASTDGTVEIAQEFGAIVISCGGRPWPNEEVKRSAYFVGDSGDEYIVIDGDEELFGTVPQEIDPVDANVTLHRSDGHPPYPVFRYHKHLNGLKYHGHHNAIWRDGKHVKRKHCPENYRLAGIHFK